MEHEQQPGKYRKGEYPSPHDVVQNALNLLQPDGSLISYDDEHHEEVVYDPHDPIPLDQLSPGIYATHLLQVARAIEGTVVDISIRPDKANNVLEPLAHYLSGYRHDMSFVRSATALVVVENSTTLYPPHLPPESPREWVPKLRTK